MNNFARKPILFLAGVALFFGLAVAAFRHLNGPRVVANAVAPNGMEFRVVQQCNWSGEPFTTSCYYRKPGGAWGWFYYDHQDGYWGAAQTEIDADAKTIKIYRRGQVNITFNWETEQYDKHPLFRGGALRRE